MTDFKVSNRDMIVLCLLYITAGFLIAMSLKSALYVDFSNGDIEKYDKIGRVGCNSDSMGINLDCGDELGKIIVDPNEALRIGEIYTYKSSNHTVVHRLVECVDSDCNVTVFKGDNNKIAELVNRSDILYRVAMVRYR